MLSKLKATMNRLFFADTLPYSVRTFNFACFLAAGAAAIGLAARIAEGMPLISILTMCASLIAIIGLLWMSALRAKHAPLVTAVVVFGLGLVFWPIIFFTSGGPDSGMAAYFALVITLDFLLLKGKVRAVALALTSAAIFFCYYATLFLGWPVLPAGGMSASQMLIGNMQSILVVGFYLGFVIVLQKNVYLSEKRKAESIAREMNERMKQQQLMSSISQSFISKEPMGELIQAALAQMGTFMNVARTLVAVFEKNSEVSRPGYFWFVDPRYMPTASQKGFSKIIRELFPRHFDVTGEVPCIYCDNTLTYEEGKFKIFFEKGGLRSFICAPIYVDGELWGVMSIEEHVRFRSWTQSDAYLVGTVSSAISSAVARDIMEKERVAALEQALHASRAKGNFLSNMSHEMRTPMNAIIGMTAIGKTAQTLEKKDYALSKIDDASKHLLGVINDILDMSKIEANKLELSPVSFVFEKMLKSVVNVIQYRVDERRQKFYVHIGKGIPSTLIGDDQRLAQVITNLLSNAVKFTPEAGTITLGARLLSEENGMCRLQIDVTDTGIGISDEQKARLFHSFEQAEAGTSRKFGGTGLGLAISKNIIQLMGGEIWIESEPGHGAKFSFTALLQRDTAGPKRLLPNDVNWHNIRIFAVDDEPEVRAFFAELSESLHIDCDVAASGEEAVEMLAKDDHYDIFFLDWKLPGMNGGQLAEKIRAKSAHKSIVVVFSSVDWSMIEDEARAAGADKFLPKPLFPSAFVDVIDECVGAASAQEPLEAKAAPDDFSGHAILLVEDVEINREIVTALLEPTGIAIDCAENGAEALRLFQDAPGKYGMIFMDVQMPEMDGYEATRRIRALKDPQAKAVPIVAMTANVFREDVERCLEAGMDAHLGKPLNMDEVLVMLKRYL
ncbi:MAG: response regulator [Clostridia bacterium]|nr:response regulator [Clostridia bacterium]